MARFFAALRASASALVLASLLAAILSACAGSTQSTEQADPYGVISYNVVLRAGSDPVMSLCSPGTRITSIETSVRPMIVPDPRGGEARLRVTALCPETRQPVTYEFPYHRVEVILETSSPRVAPDSVRELANYVINCRERVGFGPFDKFEIRGLVGFRGDQDSVFYPSATGGDVYRSELFGNTRGGSSLFTGVELAGLWSFDWLDRDGRLQLGLMTGWWPVDESHFVPVGLKARYTVDPIATDPSGSTLYFFGDLGLPVDFSSDAPIIGSGLDRQRLYYGAGVGLDWPLGCTVDLSLDLALRRFTLPLPQIECCPDVPDEDRNPYRTSSAALLRVGLTW